MSVSVDDAHFENGERRRNNRRFEKRAHFSNCCKLDKLLYPNAQRNRVV